MLHRDAASQAIEIRNEVCPAACSLLKREVIKNDGGVVSELILHSRKVQENWSEAGMKVALPAGRLWWDAAQLTNFQGQLIEPCL